MSWTADLEGLGGERALDVATGSGKLARELLGRYREVVGIDTVTRGFAATEPGLALLEMDAETMSFPDGHFDLVATSWSLHHFANATRVIDEMQRVLRPGGKFLIIEPFLAPNGTNQDLHGEAHGLVAAIDRARGNCHMPLFERMQIGSIIQGLGLLDVQFAPMMVQAAEAGWDLEACQVAAAPWVERMRAASEAADLDAGLRERARALAVRLETEGMRTSPVMRTYGTKPD
nr:methyltransferase domain-containing protein [uncultured bacterium]